MTPKVHVLLVSAQAAPNLLPALDPAIKPTHVVLLTSSKMRHQGTALYSVLKESGITVQSVELPNEHDLAQIEEIVLAIASEHLSEDIAFNLTGGTKLMALAAQNVANTAGCRTFYVDVDTDEIIWLDRGDDNHKLTATLRLKHYLQSYGFSISAKQHPANPPSYQALQTTLVRNARTFEKTLGELNFIAQTAEDRNSLHVLLDDKQLDSRSLEALIRHFEDADVLTLEADRLAFANEDARFFCKGGWLEHHVFQTLNAVQARLDIRDKASNLVVEDRDGVRNELDVAFMARNRLFVIECKTARMDRAGSTKANDTLFKLSENCRRVGGLGSRGMLASFRKLNAPELKLARALNIHVVCADQLARLDEHLLQWAAN